MFSDAIVRPPCARFPRGLTTAGLGAPNYARALQQHAAYCEALEESGLKVTRLEADERYPDSTFVEDAAVVVGAHTKQKPAREQGLGRVNVLEPSRALPDGRASATENTKQKPAREQGLGRVNVLEPSRALPDGRASAMRAILTRPGAASRVGEVESIAAVLARFHSELHSIQEPGTVDGGDICEAENHFFIGISKRTNEAGAQQLSKLLVSYGCTSSFVDIRGVKDILHLKSGLAYLGDNRLVVIDDLVDHKEFRAYELVRVTAGEEYAANCVRVNDHVLVAAGYPGFEKTLQGLGYETIAVEMTEFQKMDGGLSCLSLRF